MNKIGYQNSTDNARSINAMTGQRFTFHPIESDLDPDSATPTGLVDSIAQLTGGAILYSRQQLPYNTTITQTHSRQIFNNPVGPDYKNIKTSPVMIDRSSAPEYIVSELMHRSELIAAYTTQMNRTKYSGSN